MKIIKAKIGKIELGPGNPVTVQTMCNTHTSDIEASVSQCIRVAKAGAQLIRLTTPSISDVEALAQIRERVREAGYEVPFVADIHFRSDVAFAAAKVVEKVRINPGNFHKEHDKAIEEFKKFIDTCKTYHTAIRIGVNHGSLGADITARYGNTPEGMAQAAFEWLGICIQKEFYDVVVSLKASNTVVMVQAYRCLDKMMQESGVIFPLHLGVTEAGNADSARIKSAAAISTLLSEGMGSTIRVSLTEDPEAEIPIGYEIVSRFNTENGKVISPSCAIEIKIDGKTATARYQAPSWQKLITDVSCDFGKMLIDKELDNLCISGTFIDKHGSTIDLDSEKESGLSWGEYLCNELMQACRRKFYRPEYVACPGCGRTMYSLEKVFEEVKARTAGLGNICIAVMGCIVNGPGEMADADYGYVGEGRSLVTIYRKHEAVFRHIPEDEAIDKLVNLIISDGQSRS